VTGATQGIGKAIVLKLANDGVHCAINYRSDDDKDQAIKLKKEIEKFNVNICLVKADITNKNQIDEMFETVEKELGTIDILVNSAGIAPFLPFFDVTEEVWDKTYDTNVRGTFFVSQRAAKGMVKQKEGKIINIASTASVVVT